MAIRRDYARRTARAGKWAVGQSVRTGQSMSGSRLSGMQRHDWLLRLRPIIACGVSIHWQSYADRHVDRDKEV